MNNAPTQKVVEPPYFSNWVDLIIPQVANKILPLTKIFPGITPNHITWFSFAIYILASILLFLPLHNHLLYSAILFPIAYIGDCLDGQLARTKKLGSALGNYFDKVLDVLKIYALTISLAFAVYLQTGNVLYVFLGFTACFFFNLRYYIKHETMYSAFEKDHSYLEKARNKRYELYDKIGADYKKNWKSGLIGKLKVIGHLNRSIIFVDEGEFVFFTAIAALFNRLDLVLLIFTVSQILIGFWRFIERGYQTMKGSNRLLYPMRK